MLNPAFWVGFAIGLGLGVPIGVVILAVCAASGDADGLEGDGFPLDSSNADSWHGW